MNRNRDGFASGILIILKLNDYGISISSVSIDMCINSVMEGVS